jgi:hypothetical protein
MVILLRGKIAISIMLVCGFDGRETLAFFLAEIPIVVRGTPARPDRLYGAFGQSIMRHGRLDGERL